MKRLVLALVAALVFCLAALPGQADQSFWTLTTAATPKPASTAAASWPRIDYLYYVPYNPPRFGARQRPQHAGNARLRMLNRKPATL